MENPCAGCLTFYHCFRNQENGTLTKQALKTNENQFSAKQRIEKVSHAQVQVKQVIFPVRRPDPFVLLVPNLCQTTRTELASPSHRTGSSKHSQCITHKYVSRDSPYAEFQAHRPQRISYQWGTGNSEDRKYQPEVARFQSSPKQGRAAERWRASSATGSPVSNYRWCPFFPPTHNPYRKWGHLIYWWCRDCK